MGLPVIPSPINPIFILVVFSSVDLVIVMKGGGFENRYLLTSDFLDFSSCEESEFLHPAERSDGFVRGHVFKSNPALVTAFVELAEKEGKVDLTCAGLMPSWIVCDLNVADSCKMFAEGSGYFACLALDVIDIEQHTHVRMSDFVKKLERLLGAIQNKTRDVEVIDRLDHKFNSVRGKFGSGETNVLHQRLPMFFVTVACDSFSDKAIQPVHTEDLRILGRLGNTSTEFIASARQSRDAALSGRPIARSPAGKLNRICVSPHMSSSAFKSSALNG